MRSGPFAALLVLPLAACGEGAPARERAAPVATANVLPTAEPTASAAPIVLPPPLSSAGHPAKAPADREGETSVDALFDRARRALAELDDGALVHCLERSARREWLADAMLAIEIEAQIPRYEDQLARRRALGVLHDLVRTHVGRQAAQRPATLTADGARREMLDRVRSPDALLADLLRAARLLGTPLDPVAAAREGRVGGAAAPARPVVGMAPPAAPQPAGLVRALRRIERARELAEVHLDGGQGIAFVRAADGGLEPVRLVREGDTVWIDES